MKTKYKSLLVFAILCNSILSMGQTEYAIEYSNKDTCISTSISDYDNMLRHIIPDKKIITHLYKIDLVQIARRRLNFSFEHSIKHKLSLEHEATFRIVMQSNYSNATNLHDYLNRRDPIFIDNFSKNSLYYLSLGSNLKYYYNMDSRIRHGKNTNGFSANYFTAGFKINMAFYNTDKWHVDEYGTLNEYPYSHMPKNTLQIIFQDDYNKESMGYIRFGYGIQRRIGNVGFWSAEARAGIGTNKFFDILYIPIQFNVKAGFALSSLKRNR